MNTSKEKLIVFIFLAVLFIMQCGKVEGAAKSIYIAQTARGNDSGLDTANAHSVAWFNASNNWGTGSGIICAGDTVRLCGIISTPLTINGSGVAGKPIIILFQLNAKLSAPVWKSSAITFSTQNWIVIDGGKNGKIICTDNGTMLTNKASVYGINSTGDVNNIIVKNLTIDSLYVRTPGSTTDENRYGVAINLSGSNITIQNCTLKEGDTMIGLSWSTGTDSNITIKENIIGRCNHGICLGTSDINAFLNNIEISHNTINDLDVWNGVSGNHLDGIIIFNESKDYSGCINNLQIFSNKIGPNIGNINTSACFVICYKALQVQGMKIYNNIFFSRPPYYWTNGFIAAAGLNCIIANNTIIGKGTAISTKFKAICYNNLNYNIGTGLYVVDGDTVANFDYNVLNFPNPTESNFLMIYNQNKDRFNSWATWKQATGFDTHSSCHKPVFDTITGILSITDTIARCKGKNLSTWFSKDFFGNSRPSGDTMWDIGAYQSPSKKTNVVSDPKHNVFPKKSTPNENQKTGMYFNFQGRQIARGNFVKLGINLVQENGEVLKILKNR